MLEELRKKDIYYLPDKRVDEMWKKVFHEIYEVAVKSFNLSLSVVADASADAYFAPSPVTERLAIIDGDGLQLQISNCRTMSILISRIQIQELGQLFAIKFLGNHRKMHQINT